MEQALGTRDGGEVIGGLLSKKLIRGRPSYPAVCVCAEWVQFSHQTLFLERLPVLRYVFGGYERDSFTLQRTTKQF